MTRYSSNNNIIRYVLPLLTVMSCFHIIGLLMHCNTLQYRRRRSVLHSAVSVVVPIVLYSLCTLCVVRQNVAAPLSKTFRPKKCILTNMERCAVKHHLH